MKSEKVLACVVTHNRLKLLVECISAIKAQTRQVDGIIVIDNESTDGTAEHFSQDDFVRVVPNTNKYFCAGGFSEGLRRGYKENAEWIWLMDDDTIPGADALENMLRSPVAKEDGVGFLCSRQYYMDGRLPPNDPVPLSPDLWVHRVLDTKAIPVAYASFVSLMIHRRAVSAVGLPIREMCLSGEDYEYTQRISSARLDGYAVLDSVVEHRCSPPMHFDTTTWSAWKLKFGLRNRIYLVRKYSKGGRLGKGLLIFRILSAEFWKLVRGRSTFGILFSGVSGLFFNPRLTGVDS